MSKSRTWAVTAGMLAGVAVLACAAACGGATYYVSTKGDNGNEGLSAKTAWKSPAKVSAARLNPGDQVLFERGGEWREPLVASSDGAAGKPIVYGTYGSGEKPRFLGSEILPNADFRPVEGAPGIYTIKTAFAVDRHRGMAVDHQLLPWTGFANDENLAKVKKTPDAYVIEDGFISGRGQITPTSVITVHTGGSDPRTDGKVYTICVRGDMIRTNYKSHLVFRDLVTDETAALESGYGWRIEVSTDIRIENGEAYRVGVAHFGIISGDQVVLVNCRAAWAMPNQTYMGPSAFFSNNDGTGSVTLEDCVVDHMEVPAGHKPYNALGCVGKGKGTVTVRKMISGAGGGISIGAAGQVNILGGKFDNCYVEMFSPNVLIDGTTFFGNATCLDTFAGGYTVQNCVITNCNPKNPSSYPAVFVVRAKAVGSTFRFNTVVLGPDAGDGSGILALPGGSKTNLYGNVFIGKKPVVLGGDAGDAGQVDYNVYHANPTFGAMDLAKWQAAGFDIHSLTGDPKFTNPAAWGYSLQAGSPAIDKVRVPKALVPAKDFAGNPRSSGAAPDMGAYESK